MVIQKMGVEDKEAYAWSFEVILVIFDFLPTEVSNPLKWPPLKNYTIECLTTIVAPWNACEHPCKHPKTRGVEISIISEFKIFKWAEDEAITNEIIFLKIYTSKPAKVMTIRPNSIYALICL